MSFQIAAFADESDDRFAGQIEALKRNAMPYLEIRNLNGKNVTELTAAQASEIEKELEDNGLAVWSIGSPIGKIPIEAPFEPHLELFKHTLELAKVFKTRRLRLFSFFMPDEKDPAEYKNAVLERLDAFVRVADGYDIVLCHENEKGIYGDVASRCAEIHRALPSVRCVFDPANFVQCGQDTLAAWALLQPYVDYMHIKDALADGRVVPPGTGIGNLQTLLNNYRAQGGKVLTLEPHLYDFVGLKSLERESDASVVGAMGFETAQAAFDYAAQSLQKLLNA